MELTCLSCAGAFTVNEGGLAPSGAVIECPHCGRKQEFVRRPEGAGTTPPRPFAGAGPRPTPPPHAAGDAGAFRKPMQAFSTYRTQAPSAEMPKAKAESTDRRKPAPPTTPPFQVPGPGTTPPGLAAAAAAAGDAGTPWLVRSPTGLVLEFPSSHLLVNWSAIVDNAAPYQVSRGGDEWTSLDSFVREVKLGSRATQVYNRMASSTPLPSSVPVPTDPGGPGRSSTTQSAAARSGTNGALTTPIGGSLPPPRAVSSTTQFQFKIADTSTKRWPRVVIGIAIALGLLGGAAGAAFYLGLFN